MHSYHIGAGHRPFPPNWAQKIFCWRKRPRPCLPSVCARLGRPVRLCLCLVGGRVHSSKAFGMIQWKKEGEAFTKQFVAKPGCSEHETGLAIDLARAARNIDFIRPHLPYDGACGRFRALAAKYGFIQRYRAEKTAVTGIACEPWHFRYVGAPHAQLIEQNGLCLEEYAAFLREMGPQQCRLAGGRAAQVLYVPCENGHARLPGGCVQVSGDNAGGFIATVWQAGARRCGA